MSDADATEGQPGALPSPGSDEARALGCLCPVLDNGRGRGYMGQPGVYVFDAGCPLHHPKGVPDARS